MLYQRRMGLRALWDMTNKSKSRGGVYDEARLVAEIKRELIEGGVADMPALEALAVVRAKAVYDFILADGFDARRLSIGPSRQEQASMGFVPLEFTLTVFQDPEQTDNR
jgi:hypothetical protein